MSPHPVSGGHSRSAASPRTDAGVPPLRFDDTAPHHLVCDDPRADLGAWRCEFGEQGRLRSCPFVRTIRSSDTAPTGDRHPPGGWLAPVSRGCEWVELVDPRGIRWFTSGGEGELRWSATTIGRARFERLRRERIDAADIGGPCGGALPFARFASWAVWRTPTTARSTADLAVLDYDELRATIHADAVFVSLAGGPSSDGPEADWSAFHRDPRDTALAVALAATPDGREQLWGAYMTSFFKDPALAADGDAAARLAALSRAERTRLIAVMSDRLAHELDVLGTVAPVLVCLGDEAHRVVGGALGDRHTVLGLRRIDVGGGRLDTWV